MRLYRGIDLHQKDCFLWAIDNRGKTHLMFWCHLRPFGERGQPGSLTVTNPYGGSVRTAFFRAIREGSS